jgi:hypothetical protein
VGRVYNRRRLLLGCRVRFRLGFRLLLVLIVNSVLATPQDAPKARISKQTRQQILHAFDSDLVYVRTNFPMGKTGLKLKDGTLTPNGPELQHLMALWGPAAKPGDLARITDIIFKADHIRFEINGGPVKKQKWYQRIEIEGAAGVPVTPSDSRANARGSFVDLCFDKYVPEMTGPELKQALRPVFDFDSKSPLDAYLETVPPKVKEAIKNHYVLVGMNRDMVIFAKGRASKKVRERAGEVEYEDWIYGTPPQDVEFVRFVGDEVVRVETMKVDGQKEVRTEKEVELAAPAVAQKQQERPLNAPTLRRPGEAMPDSNPQSPSRTPPVASPPPPGPDKNPAPNWAAAQAGG